MGVCFVYIAIVLGQPLGLSKEVSYAHMSVRAWQEVHWSSVYNTAQALDKVQILIKQMDFKSRQTFFSLFFSFFSFFESKWFFIEKASHNKLYFISF